MKGSVPSSTSNCSVNITLANSTPRNAAATAVFIGYKLVTLVLELLAHLNFNNLVAYQVENLAILHFLMPLRRFWTH